MKIIFVKLHGITKVNTNVAECTLSHFFSSVLQFFSSVSGVAVYPWVPEGWAK